MKPFGDPLIEDAIARSTGPVVTLENHTVIGGLGSAVSEFVTDRGLGRRVVRMGLQDTYAHGASKAYLLEEYGLDAYALVHRIGRELGRELDVSREEVAAAPVEAAAASVNAESL